MLRDSFPASRLDAYIGHYEPLDYASAQVHADHLRVKRSGGEREDAEVEVRFRAHKHDFHLRLRRETSVFSQNLLLEGDGLQPLDALDTSHLYSGHLAGELSSLPPQSSLLIPISS
jgi:disintegrin and metalloproteinase domain-containing protein 10